MSNMLDNIGLRLALAFQGLSLRRLEREEGQTLAEYGLILALIALVVIGAVILLGSHINDIFNQIGSQI
jgi:pilus assembly protein Flp/PilA